MARLSISNGLKRFRRVRFLTVLACLILVVVAAQMTLFKGNKLASASYVEDGVTYNAATDTCTITRFSPLGTKDNPQRIPAFCEGKNVVIDGNGSSLYVDAGAVRVWQSTVSIKSACQSSYTDGGGTIWDLLYLDDLSGQCVYQQRNAISLNYIVTFGPNLPLPPSNGDEYTIRVPKTSTNVYNDYFFQLTGFDANGCVSPFAGNNFQYFGFKNGLCYYNYSAAGNKYYSAKTPNSTTYTAGSDCTALDAASAFSDCDSGRHFKNLTLKNGSILTHSRILYSDMQQDSGAYTKSGKNDIAGSLADNVTGTARWKKVDLQVTGIIDVESGSSINVNSKGYPVFSDYYQINKQSCVGNGFGIGGGLGGTMGNKTDNGQGGGGGYGGAGQGGTWPGGSLVYGDVDLNVFDFGSAGGATRTNGKCATQDNGFDAPPYGGKDVNNGYVDTPASRGGGRIKIVAGTVKLSSDNNIVANGGDAYHWATDYSGGGPHSGAGSGGSIFLKYSNIETNLSDVLTVFAKGGNSNAGDGSVKIVNASLLTTTTDAFITSNGGAGDGMAGGGGRIYIEKVQAPVVTVSKKLIAVNRNSASPADTNFNPYALQVGDVIKVELKMGSYTGTVNLTDQYLKVPGGSAKCAYYAGAGAPSAPTASTPNSADADITFIGLDATTYANGLTPITYYCKVQN